MQTLVVIGATGDLGRGVVPRLARDYRLAVVYREADRFARLQEANGGALTGLDSLAGVAQLGPIHGLVHLAGGFALGSAAADFARMFAINVQPFAEAVEAVVPHLADRGRIVAISSAASLTRPAGLAAYSASKAALNATVETLAKDLHPRGITVNALLPTTLDTPANRASMQPDQLVPLDRIAETIAFLLSQAAQNVTGQLLALTGA
jgi:NAD(P)-dependent dehydrogenase (short-subunit alcohol dehydrogenase family)